MKFPIKIWIGGKEENIRKLLQHKIVKNNIDLRDVIIDLWKCRKENLNSIHIYGLNFGRFYVVPSRLEYLDFKIWKTEGDHKQEELILFHKRRKLDSKRLPR